MDSTQNNTNRNRENIVEEFLVPRHHQAKFWRWLVLSLVFIAMVYVYKVRVIDTTIEPEVLKKSLEIFNIDSQWVVGEEIDTPDFKGILLVPQVSFQVRNIGEIDLSYIYFLGVFRLTDRADNLGEGFNMALKKPLHPGEESPRITLTCPFGYRATSTEAFQRNAENWARSLVQVFVRAGGSRLSLVNTYFIARRIEGLDVSIQLTGQPVKEESINIQ